MPQQSVSFHRWLPTRLNHYFNAQPGSVNCKPLLRKIDTYLLSKFRKLQFLILVGTAALQFRYATKVQDKYRRNEHGQVYKQVKSLTTEKKIEKNNRFDGSWENMSTYADWCWSCFTLWTCAISVRTQNKLSCKNPCRFDPERLDL